MNARNLLPVVVLLTLTVPPTGAVAPAVGTDSSVSRVAAPARTSAPDASRARALAEPRSRRRGRGGIETAISAEDVALASEYLRCRADGREPAALSLRGWERFFPACDDAVRRFAGSFRSRGIDVDDCAQEAWVDLLRRLPTFELDGSRGRFTSWLYSVVRSKAADQVRRRSRQAAEPLDPSTTSALASPNDDPARKAARLADGEAVRRALASLKAGSSELNYQILHLRRMCGRPVPEVASLLGLSSRQVWLREHRMKRKLRELLEAKTA